MWIGELLILQGIDREWYTRKIKVDEPRNFDWCRLHCSGRGRRNSIKRVYSSWCSLHLRLNYVYTHSSMYTIYLYVCIFTHCKDKDGMILKVIACKCDTQSFMFVFHWTDGPFYVYIEVCLYEIGIYCWRNLNHSLRRIKCLR